MHLQKFFVVRFAECDFLLVFSIVLTRIACIVSQIIATTGLPQSSVKLENLAVYCRASEGRGWGVSGCYSTKPTTMQSFVAISKKNVGDIRDREFVLPEKSGSKFTKNF